MDEKKQAQKLGDKERTKRMRGMTKLRVAKDKYPRYFNWVF